MKPRHPIHNTIMLTLCIALASCDDKAKTEPVGNAPIDSPNVETFPTEEDIRRELVSHPSLDEKFVTFLSIQVENGHAVIRLDKSAAAKAEGPSNTVQDLLYNEQAVMRKYEFVEKVADQIKGLKSITCQPN